MTVRRLALLACGLMVTATFVVGGCSKSLSRANAGKQIVKELKYPQGVIGSWPLILGDPAYGFGEGHGELQDMQLFGNWGALTFKYHREVFGMNSYYEATLTPGQTTFTADGKYRYTAKLADRQFVGVTGVVQNSNTAQVEYTWKYANQTLVGKNSLKYRTGRDAEFMIDDSLHTETVSFKKYDDGWRLQK